MRCWVYEARISWYSTEKIVAIVKHEIVKKAADADLVPYIDWGKVNKKFGIKYVKIVSGDHIIYIAGEQFDIIAQTDSSSSYRIYESSEKEIPEELVPYLRNDVRELVKCEEEI